MNHSFELIFRRDKADAQRAKFLSRLFGLFSEEIVRLWAADARSPYDDLGRPTLKAAGGSRGHTLDFALRHRSTGKVYVTEMKCEIEYQNFNYFSLTSTAQLDHHKKPAFKAFLDAAADPSAQNVTVKGAPIKVDGAILIWGTVTDSGRDAVRAKFGLHEVLSVADISRDLVNWRNEGYAELIAQRRQWTQELFDGVLQGSDALRA